MQAWLKYTDLGFYYTVGPRFSAASISEIFGLVRFFGWSLLLLYLASVLVRFLDKTSVSAGFLWNHYYIILTWISAFSV